jgi:hypothetical protein
MAVADDGMRFKYRRGYTNRDQHNRGGGHHNRSRGVHGNTERAMIGSGLVRMDMRYLDHGQQGQQDKTQNSHDRQSP